MNRTLNALDRRIVAWLAVLVAGGAFAQSLVITEHENQVVRLVENNAPAAVLLLAVFLLISAGCLFLVLPAVKCSMEPGRRTNWSSLRTPLATLATGLWAVLPLTWASSIPEAGHGGFLTRQTVLAQETNARGGTRLIVTSWRGLPREVLSTPGRRLEAFKVGDTVEIGLVTSSAGTLGVTSIVAVAGPGGAPGALR